MKLQLQSTLVWFTQCQYLKVSTHNNVLKNLKGLALLFAIWLLERYAKLWFQIQPILSGITKEDHTEQRDFNRFVWTPGSEGKKSHIIGSLPHVNCFMKREVEL